MCNRSGCLYPQLAEGQPYPPNEEVMRPSMPVPEVERLVRSVPGLRAIDRMLTVEHRDDDQPCACDDCMAYGAEDSGADWARIPVANRIAIRVLDSGDGRLAELAAAFRDHDAASQDAAPTDDIRALAATVDHEYGGGYPAPDTLESASRVEMWLSNLGAASMLPMECRNPDCTLGPRHPWRCEYEQAEAVR